MKLLFNLQQWLSEEVLRCIPLKEIEPDSFIGENYKKKAIEENEERKLIKEFILELKKKKTENKEAYISSKLLFPELIEIPETKFLKERIIRNLKSFTDKYGIDIYCKLLENNKIPVYYNLIKSLSSDTGGRGVYVFCDVRKDEDYHLNIFKHALLLCKPQDVQTCFEYLYDEYEELNKIDSKKEQKNKTEEFQFYFHKSLRQTDPLENAHAEMIIHNLMNMSNLPNRAIEAIVEHVKDEL